MFQVKCPRCQQKLAVDDAMAGRVGVCPTCRQMFRIPALQTPASAPPPSPRAGVPPAKWPAPRLEESWEEHDPGPYAVAREPEPPPPPAPLMRHPLEDELPEEEDRLDRGPVRRRRRKRRAPEAQRVPGGSYFLAQMLILLFVWALFAVLGYFVPRAAILPLVTGIILHLAAGIWFLATAFEDDGPAVGLLCLLLPFYGLYYLGTHWDRESRPFFVSLVAALFLFTGIAFLVLHRAPP